MSDIKPDPIAAIRKVAKGMRDSGAAAILTYAAAEVAMWDATIAHLGGEGEELAAVLLQVVRAFPGMFGTYHTDSCSTPWAKCDCYAGQARDLL